MTDPTVDPTPVDPPEFRRDLVPADATADLFFDGDTGRGLTNAEWDEQKARLAEHTDTQEA